MNNGASRAVSSGKAAFKRSKRSHNRARLNIDIHEIHEIHGLGKTGIEGQLTPRPSWNLELMSKNAYGD